MQRFARQHAAPACGFEKTGQQAQQGGFPRTVWADERNQFTFVRASDTSSITVCQLRDSEALQR
jgi:hypothetical protein